MRSETKLTPDVLVETRTSPSSRSSTMTERTYAWVISCSDEEFEQRLAYARRSLSQRGQWRW